MEISNNQRRKWLLILLAINTLAIIFHLTNNIISFDQSPELSWINPHLIELFGLLMMPFGIAGYFQYVKGAFFSSYLCLYAYSMVSLATFGYWLISPPWEMSWKTNVFILCNVVTATALIGFVVWSQILVFVKAGRKTTQ